MRISHEAIYQALYVQGRGALRRELTACLRTGRALRVPRVRSRGRGKSFIAPEGQPPSGAMRASCPSKTVDQPHRMDRPSVGAIGGCSAVRCTS
jgi:hypothetical protein